MAVNTYSVGQQVKLTGTFKNEAGTLTDPTTVFFILIDGQGVEAEVTSPTHVSTGLYTALHTVAATEAGGKTFYRAVGEGALIAAGEGIYNVNQLRTKR